MLSGWLEGVCCLFTSYFASVCTCTTFSLSIKKIVKKKMLSFPGPKLFKEPSFKSNKFIIHNALSRCCLAGKVNETQKNKIVEVDGFFYIFFSSYLLWEHATFCCSCSQSKGGLTHSHGDPLTTSPASLSSSSFLPLANLGDGEEPCQSLPHPLPWLQLPVQGCLHHESRVPGAGAFGRGRTADNQLHAGGVHLQIQLRQETI